MNRFRPLIVLLYLAFCLLPAAAQAEDFIKWSTSNIQLLRGWDYEVGESKRAIVTLEHANQWKYGDLFMFADFTRFDSGGSSYYIEPSPRISLGEILDKDLSNGALKDLFIAGSFEYPEDGPLTSLYGLGAGWKLSQFKYLNTNLYLRDNPDLTGESWQVTIAWGLPFSLFGLDALTEGFADFAGSEASSKANQLIVPRLLIDLGKELGVPPASFYAGIEWQYWHNKYGIDGVTESVPQLMIKWVLH